MNESVRDYFAKIGSKGGKNTTPAKIAANKARAIARWSAIKAAKSVKFSDKVSESNTLVPNSLASAD